MHSKGIYIFLCNSDTRGDVLSKMLVGTRHDDWKRDFHRIATGDHVLVYDYNAFEFIGPFRVVMHCGGKPIEKGAWRGKFPAQAQVEYAGKGTTKSLQEVVATIGNNSILRQGKDMPYSYVDGHAAAQLRELFGITSPNASQSMPSVAVNRPLAAHPQHSARAPSLSSQSTVQPEALGPRRAEHHGFKAVQGFEVRSKAERDIASLLDRFGILCHYERPIPGGGGYLCDFYLPQYDVYIEYWGLHGDAAYDNRRRVKTRVYTENGLRLIEIEPADERSLEARLTHELRRFGVKVDVPGSRPRKVGWFRRLLASIRRLLVG